jgi:hypothetical protein
MSDQSAFSQCMTAAGWKIAGAQRIKDVLLATALGGRLLMVNAPPEIKRIPRELGFDTVFCQTHSSTGKPGVDCLCNEADWRFLPKSFQTAFVWLFGPQKSDSIADICRQLGAIVRRNVYVEWHPANGAWETPQECMEQHSCIWWNLHREGFRYSPAAPLLIPGDEIARIDLPIRLVMELAPADLDSDGQRDWLRANPQTATLPLYFYSNATKWIFHNDRVLDISRDAGCGSWIIHHTSRAGFVHCVVEEEFLSYAQMHYGNPRISHDFRLPIDLKEKQGRPDFDVIVFLQPHAPVRMTELASMADHLLVPGGRLVVGCSPGWMEKSDALTSYITETEFRLHAGGVSEELQMRVWRRSPLFIPGRQTYQEHILEIPGGGSSLDKEYQNPWILNAIANVSFRVTARAELERLAAQVASTSSPLSADHAAAVCVLMYIYLSRLAPCPPEIVRQAIAFLDSPAEGRHVHRWRISLSFALAKHYMLSGQNPAAILWFRRCTAFDAFLFSPHLATKPCEACFWLGWLHLIKGETEAARSEWVNSRALLERLLKSTTEDIFIIPDSPNLFDYGDGMREFVLALEWIGMCHNGLALLSDCAPERINASLIMGSFHRNIVLLQERTRELDSARQSLAWHAAELERARADAQAARDAARSLSLRLEAADRERLDLLAACALCGIRNPEKARTAIYGTSGLAKAMLAEARKCRIKVIAFVDSHKENWGRLIAGIHCISPSDLRASGVTDVLIASESQAEQILSVLAQVYKDSEMPSIHRVKTAGS